MAQQGFGNPHARCDQQQGYRRGASAAFQPTHFSGAALPQQQLLVGASYYPACLPASTLQLVLLLL